MPKRAFDLLKEGLEEAIEHAKGNVKLRVNMIEIPEPPKPYKPRDIKKIRKKYNCSQTVFASLLNVSPKTLQAWEIGDRHPTSSALRLLEFFDHPKQSQKLLSGLQQR